MEKLAGYRAAVRAIFPTAICRRHLFRDDRGAFDRNVVYVEGEAVATAKTAREAWCLASRELRVKLPER